jgi:hypothetical protein
MPQQQIKSDVDWRNQAILAGVLVVLVVLGVVIALVMGHGKDLPQAAQWVRDHAEQIRSAIDYLFEHPPKWLPEHPPRLPPKL